MLSIALMTAGSEDYYLSLAATDYYLKGGEPRGLWIGSGCSFFKLGTHVEPDQLKLLFNGFHPIPEVKAGKPPPKEPLVQNAGRPNRQAGWDLTFSVPKSVSVVWTQAEREERELIQRLHHQAVAETLQFAELTLAQSRTGHAGRGEWVDVKLVAAAFEHGTSRAEDPQLHSHLLVMNIGVDQDGRTRSIVSKPIFKNKMLLGAMYRAYLAQLLYEKLGLVAERKGTAFELTGVPEDLMQHYSKRRQEVCLDMIRKGRSGGKAAAKSAIETRRTKKNVRPREELFAEWQAINEQFGFNSEALAALLNPVKSDLTRFIPNILQTALDNLTQNVSHFTAHEFFREVLYLAPEYGVSPHSLFEPVGQLLANAERVIPIPIGNGELRYTTVGILDLESAMLRSLKSLYDRPGLFVEDEKLNAALQQNPHLNQEQQDAVRHITQGKHAIRFVQGYAGTGKTTMLRTAVQAWKASGFEVVGACFTGAAAEKLSDEIGIPCDTIHRTLADFKVSPKHRLKHHLRQFVRASQRKRTYRYQEPKPVAIDEQTIILLDEAGMINTVHMKLLLEWADKHGATIVPVGDAAQLAAVEGGSPFRSLSNRVGYARMNEIKRQQDEWARAASLFLARGQVAEALAFYDQRNLIKSFENIGDALTRLVHDWADHAYDRPHHARILAATNDQVHLANELAQQERIDRGVLNTNESQSITDQMSTGVAYNSTVYLGDRVIFTKNEKRKYGVLNGSAGTVIRFKPHGRMKRPGLIVKLDSGKTVHVPVSFKHIRLGYASTVYKAQGGTFEEAFVLLSGASQNLPLSYVQGTRSRQATHFYTEKALYDQIQDLKDCPLVAQMERAVDLSLAADHFVPRTAIAETKVGLLNEVLSHWKITSLDKNKLGIVVTDDPDLASTINERCSRMQRQHAQEEWEKMRRLAHDQALADGHHEAEIQDRVVCVGDRIRFLKGGFATGITPNDFATVTKLDVRQELVELKLDRGQEVRMLFRDMHRFEPGYAVTVEDIPKCQYRVENAYEVESKWSKFLDYVTYRLFPHSSHTDPIYKYSEQQSPSANRPTYEPPPASQPTDYLKWNDPQPVFGCTTTGNLHPPQHTYTFQQTQAQQAAAHQQQQMQQLNQATSWHVQQAQYLQQLGHTQQQSITTHQHGFGP
jgi:conjugative relaxase-like TrwC/TraI family protein